MPACLAAVGVACTLLLPTPGGISANVATVKKPPAPKVQKARLHHGRAIAPKVAPPRIKKVIASANRIRHTPYIWGGGHGSFRSSGYDCSGSVSYALHGGQFVRTPLDSSRLESWGKSGKGKWITVYANAEHAWMVVAGIRWDTVGGPGPRWHKKINSHSGFVVRHPVGY